MTIERWRQFLLERLDRVRKLFGLLRQTQARQRAR
jgi:hypothetical protein